MEDAREGISRVTERVRNTVTGQVISNGYTRMVNGIGQNNTQNTNNNGTDMREYRS